MDRKLLFSFEADLGGDQGAIAKDQSGSRGAFWGAELHPLSNSLVLMIVPGTFRKRGPGLYLIDIENKKATAEPWFRPESVDQSRKLISPMLGVDLCSLSSNRLGLESTAAFATGSNYVSYWKVGTLEGGYLEIADNSHSTAVCPTGGSLAIGTGSYVLDDDSDASAAIELWDLPESLNGDSVLISQRRLPGSVVAKLLWVRKEEGLFRSNIYNRVKPHMLQEVILAVTVSRDQRTGFAAMLDPLYLEIIEICDFRLPTLHSNIQAWHEEEEPFFRIDGYGARYFSSFYQTVCSDSSLDIHAAPLRTPLVNHLSARLGPSLEVSISSGADPERATIGVYLLNS